MTIVAPHRLLVAGLTAILAGAMLAACAAPGGEDSGNAATVNGKAITNAEFNRQAKSVTESLIAQKVADPATDEGKAIIEQVKGDLLNQLIDTELMRQAAQKEGITVTDAEVDAQMKQSIEDAGGDQVFKDSLKQAGLTEQDFRAYVIRDQMLYEQLYAKVTAALPASAEQVRSRHILVETEKEAKDILARLQKGENFAALAKELSQDPGSKDTGGDLDFYPRGLLDPGFENAIFSMAPNELRVVQTDYGYHVIQMMEKQANHVLAPDVQQALSEMAMTTYFEKLRSAAKIVILAKLAPTPTPSQ